MQAAVIQHKSPPHTWQNKMAAKIQKKSQCRAGKTTRRLEEITVHGWKSNMGAWGLFSAEITVRNWQHKMAAGFLAEITVHSWQHKMAAYFEQNPPCATGNTR
jgi:hypothetical protein